MRKSIAFLLLCCVSSLLFAGKYKPLSYYPFLVGGINAHAYQQCQKFLSQCASQTSQTQQRCTAVVLQKHSVCQGIHSLAKLLDANVDALTVKRYGNLDLVTVHYLADGQQQFYIVTPRGKLVTMNVDLKKLSSKLTKKYRKVKLVTVSQKPPRYKRSDSDNQYFYIRLQVRHGCLACEPLAAATVRFKFDEKGKFKKVSLKKFKKIDD